jgi:HK97 family phage major capsid protein
MSKRQRYFSDVNRLMGVGGRVAQRKQLDNGGTGAGGSVEAPKVDLGAPITASSLESGGKEKIGENIARTMEGIRTQLNIAVNAARTQGEKLEALAKANEDMVALVKNQDEVLKDYRNALRAPIADAKETKGKIDLSGIKPMRSAVTDAELKDKQDMIAAALGQMPVDQFNLTCRSAVELGLDPNGIAARAIDRYQALSDFSALLRPWLARKNPDAYHQFANMPTERERVELGAKLQEALKVALADDAMSTINTTVGGNWVRPEVLSSRILPYVENERVSLRFFEQIQMPTKVMSIGVLGSVGYPSGLAENDNAAGDTTDATILTQAITTYKATLTAKGYATAVVATPWWFEDGIVGADFIIRELASWMGRGEERWLWNGQATASIDTPAPSTTAPIDIRSLSDGLRYMAKQIWTAGLCSPIDLSGGMTGEDVAKIFGVQGRYAHRFRQSIFGMSPMGMTYALILKTQTGHNLVQTYAELGRPGTIETGSIGMLYGRPIVVSDEISEGMDANGYEAVGGSATAIYHVFTDAVKVGRRTGMRVEFSDQFRFLQHQDVFKVTARSDIQKGYNTSSVTEPFINAGVGLPELS